MKSTSDLKKKLKVEQGTTDWKALQAHLRRGAVILVDPELSLVDVGAQLAADNTEQTRAWIAEKKISKPNSEKTRTWEENDVELDCLILQPYVLVQERPAS